MRYTLVLLLALSACADGSAHRFLQNVGSAAATTANQNPVRWPVVPAPTVGYQQECWPAPAASVADSTGPATYYECN